MLGHIPWRVAVGTDPPLRLILCYTPGQDGHRSSGPARLRPRMAPPLRAWARLTSYPLQIFWLPTAFPRTRCLGGRPAASPPPGRPRPMVRSCRPFYLARPAPTTRGIASAVASPPSALDLACLSASPVCDDGDWQRLLLFRVTVRRCQVAFPNSLRTNSLVCIMIITRRRHGRTVLLARAPPKGSRGTGRPRGPGPVHHTPSVRACRS